jgi:PncC family amidohydrolase
MADTEIIKKIHDIFGARGLTLAVAESCTSGLISHAIASLPGTYGFFDSALICNSPESTGRLLGVKSSVIKKHWPVSEELAREMAGGAEEMTGADVALAVSCGLQKEGEQRNPGIVYIAVSSGREATSRGFMFEGPPEEIIRAASSAALHFLYEAVSAWT